MVEIYGVEHILYLIISIVLSVFGYVYILKHVQTERQLGITVKAIALVLFIAILANRLSVVWVKSDGDFMQFLPATYCGVSSFAISIGVLFLKKDSPYFHGTVYIGFLGGLLTMIYPDFIVQDDSFFYLPTITGMLHHTLMIFLVVVLIGTQYVKPTLKKWYILIIGIMGYITYGAILIAKFGYDDAMYILEPVLEGTMFDFVGFGYLLFPVHFMYLYLWDKYKHKLGLLSIEAA